MVGFVAVLTVNFGPSDEEMSTISDSFLLVYEFVSQTTLEFVNNRKIR